MSLRVIKLILHSPYHQFISQGKELNRLPYWQRFERIIANIVIFMHIYVINFVDELKETLYNICFKNFE